MQIINSTNTPNFKAIRNYKLKNFESLKLQEINSMYDEFFVKMRKMNAPSRLKFKTPFPGLYDKENNHGIVLHSDDDINSNFYIHRSGTKALKVDFLNGGKKPVFTCLFNDEDFSIETSSEYDSNSENNIESDVKKLFTSVIKEMNFLIDYTRSFKSIRKILQGVSTKSQIAQIIHKHGKNAVPTEYAKSNEVKKLLLDYEIFNQALYHRRGAFVGVFKQAYPRCKGEQKSKGVTFETKDGEKINFMPMKTADNRIFRICKYDKDNNLKLGLYGYSDGAMSKIVDLDKQARGCNIKKIYNSDVEELNIPSIIRFLDEEINEFRRYLNDLIMSDRLIKPMHGSAYIRPIEENTVEHNEVEPVIKSIINDKHITEPESAIKIEAEQSIAELNNVHKTGAVKKTKINGKKQQKILLKKQEKEKLAELKRIRRLRRASKKKVVDYKELKPSNPELNLNVDMTSNVKFNPEKPIVLTEVISRIEDVFNTPVEKRHPRYSHLKMKDGTVFSGKFSINASDGAKVSVTRVKSSKFMDFTYYVIAVEKNGKKNVLNLDPEYNKIINVNKDGKPVVINGYLKHISKEAFMCTDNSKLDWNRYIYELFFNNSQDGTIEKSNLVRFNKKIKKSPEEEFEKELKEIELASLYKFN